MSAGSGAAGANQKWHEVEGQVHLDQAANQPQRFGEQSPSLTFML